MWNRQDSTIKMFFNQKIFIIGLIGLIKTINSELTPPYFNLATGRNIYSTATCGYGIEGRELYCKLVGANTENEFVKDNNYSLIHGQVCDYCDPTNPERNHPPDNAIDGTESWWQSPPLSRGMKYNEVNLTIDFGQEFHVAYLFIRMGNSPRPGLWTLEKSSDYGETWSAWQHFSDTPADCETYFGRDSYKPITHDDDVVCTTEYSKIVPLENGEIPVMLLKDRPSSNAYFNSSVLQEWTRATNVRIRLLRTKNLLGHLMSVARQDPTVTRRYFYSIKDISIGGRCMCNGHADTCDVLDAKSVRRILACRCQHRTCGIQCNECCPGYEQKKWRQNTKARPFQCEPCNCHGHTNECIYDEKTDLEGLSVDIHGNYDGGGICQHCQHNTEGINCNKCVSKYFRPYGKAWNETDVCKACDCDHFYSTGNCEEESGNCECRKAFQPPNCDSCAYGYFGYPNCRECECNLGGTDGYHCEARSGFCPCKQNFAGHYCKECNEGFYAFPNCTACACSDIGSVNSNCHLETGQCICLPNFGGHNCEICKHGYYSHPTCTYCDCDNHGTEEEICSKITGKCLCREGFGGPRCDVCLPGYYNYPDCVPCNCSSLGSTSTTCDAFGKCNCLTNFAGKQCTLCSAGYYSYPDCLSCNCDSHGSEGISCNSDGQCLCLQNFDGKVCDVCKEGYYNFPACEECNCDPAGVVARFGGCGSVPAGELCQCKQRVAGRICNQCKPLFWNLNISNPEGCEVCDCHLDGTVGALDTCDSKTGQCTCKPSVQSRQCRECKDGTFDLNGGSLFGCKDCDCDIGGARNSNCDKTNGQCVCHPRVAGRTCTQPLTTHYFPTLYQFQFEYEDGYTPSGAHVRYQYDDEQFPDFSGKGYAVFSGIQNKVINEINVFKSSVYRLVIRYVNPTAEEIVAIILIQSDNPSEVDQTTKVLFKPSDIPQFVTVSGSKGDKPFPIVLDPGRYTISVESTKNIMLDYFVILPAAYYEASILTRKIANPCEIGNLDLCRLYKYPSVSEFKPANEPFISEGDKIVQQTELYEDTEHLAIIDHSGLVPSISDDQRSLKYLIDVPHTGRYIIVIDYVTNREIPETYFVKIRNSEDPNDYGTATLYTCLYSMPCRQPVLDAESREKYFFIDVTDLKPIEVYHEHDDFGQVGILQVTAIPVEQWSVDFIQPSAVCVIHDRECASTKFRSAPDSKKIEFEFDHEDKIASLKPPYAIFDENIKLILLDKNNATISIISKVSEPGRYAILIRYYQPKHPRYNVPFRLDTDKQIYDGKFEVQHCPSSSGCRTLIRPDHDNWWFDIEDDFKLTLTNNRQKGVWLDYFLIVPIDQYTHALLAEEPFDQTQEFIRKCGQDNFYVPLNASDFCKKAVFSLTADYNHGALPCNCHYDGSTSFECDPYGGQCQCKPNIIGRHCDACRTGFYGFPDCKPCDCPLTALCEKNTGECICPPHVTGEKCDQCKPYTYGFHQIIGCEECNCNSMGVQYGNMQCDLHNGTCVCRHNIEGRACDECINGHYNFPHCGTCNCNVPGSRFEICDKNDGSCFCKKNVVGQNCQHCVDGTYNIQSENPDGCTTCFCFGKTTRCESAYLRSYNVSLLKKVSVNNAIIDEDGKKVSFEPWKININQILINETTLSADFSYREPVEGFVYFGVLDYLLNQNNHLTAYGGYLSYTLYYTTGPFGKPMFGPDILLYSKNKILIHQSYEQPANAQNFHGSVQIVDSNFQTMDKKPVSRADLMVVLRDLEVIYIRANYWEQTVLSQLSDVTLNMADEDSENYNLYKELPVEKCNCPPGYAGLSCEDCAPGYYRDPVGAYGGYCVRCQCNGHADTCDCNTGICKDCTHSTTGAHCEMCIEGYYGNATYGTPHDCMICACPLPVDSNNFATGCEISTAGDEIHCECKPGYTGARCESCASGFYGEPEKKGDFCKPCQCSGNINADEPGSCDTISGECLNCLNNTFGPACNLCAPGYYGDAVKLKDCKNCDCNELGIMKCDPYVGTCECHQNVIGERCDRCEPDHYGFDSGLGCRACDCGIASNSSQCEDHTGECPCKSGVTGRQCDRCARDYWNYTAEGCTQCRCNKGYSRGFGCNAQTGQCECLPGVIGEKCDNCPYRWVLIKDQGCSECDVCHHALLDVTDNLYRQLAPIVKDFDSVALAYFTGQKLNFYNDLTDELEPQVKALDPNGVNMTPALEKLQSLESDSKSLMKKLSSTQENAKQSSENCQKLAKDAQEVLDASRLVNINTKNTIKEVEILSESFDTSATVKGEAAIAEAQQIHDLLQEKANEFEESADQLDKAGKLFNDIEQELTIPIKHQSQALENLKKDIGIYKNKLSDLNTWSKAASDKSHKVDDLNHNNKIAFENSKFDTVENQAKKTYRNIDDTKNLIINGELTLDTIDRNMGNLQETYEDLKMANKHVDELLPEIADKSRNLERFVKNATEKSVTLSAMANQLSDKYSDITSDKKSALKAATAYSDIVDAVTGAQKAVNNAKYAAGNATELGDGIKERAGKSHQTASELLTKARDALNKVQTDLQPHLNKSAETVKDISKLNEETEKELKDINSALEQLPTHSQREIWQAVDKAASEAKSNANLTLDILAPIVKQIPKDLETAKNMSKDIDLTNTNINETTKQVERVKELVPKLQALVDSLDKKQEAIEASGKDLGDRIEKLKRQIEMARGIANDIKVGVEFMPTTVLELKPPETLPLLATSSKVSAYFNTKNQNGFLMYLGNENRTGPHYGKNEDFMALELENGYPVLTIDLGDGSEKIVNPKYVADNKWYQVIVERTGNNVQLNIREELENGLEDIHSFKKVLPGAHNVFNVDKNSRLFVGGYPPDFNPPEDLSTSSFEGEIEELKIGDEEVGLWNFVDGSDNNKGARARDKLITKEAPSTGYRFNGNGYVILDARPHNFKQRSSIQFEFKASKDSKDGLMFYAGKHRHFISVELRNGGVVFQYKLGQHLVSIATESAFNDDQWHRIEADRDGRKGLLKVDGKVIYQEETPPRTEENLKISDQMYFGGHPGLTNHSEIVNKNFDGCIDKVVVGGVNVDLSRNMKVYGTRSGCPQKFSTSLSYRPHQFGYLKQSNVSSHNSLRINLKFRTRQKDGIIFYATNYDQSSTIGLTIDDGILILRSMKYDVSSGLKKYNDGEWHVVTALHDDIRLRLTIDDTDDFISPVSPPELNIEHGDIYFGGLPKNYIPLRYALSNLAYFTGCINDVTLNGQIINFASATDKMSGSFENCPSDLFDYDIEAVPLYYVGEDFETGIEKHKDKDISAFKPIPDGREPKPSPRVTTIRPSLKSTTELIESKITTTTTTTTTRQPLTQPPPTTPVITVPDEITEITRPRPKRPPPSSEEEHICKLPIKPDFDVDYLDGGYRFIAGREKRVEINTIPVKIKRHYEISLQFRTNEPNGLLFYASDSRHTDFIAVFLRNGQITHLFSSGRVKANITTIGEYNDGEWHTVDFIRQSNRGGLHVDNAENLDIELEDKNGRQMALQMPIYIGGTDPSHEENVNINTLLNKGTYFNGCIHKILFSKRPPDSEPITNGVVPCSDQNEEGTFFGPNGGYVKLYEHFRVGNEFTISFDFKPRTTDGILFSVHGKHAYLILELYNGSLLFSVENSENNLIEATYTPSDGVNFCDGQWRTIQAIKSQYVITLTVDGVSSQPAIGSTTKPSTDTSRPLFMGGHPFIQRIRGLRSRKYYHGCIKNLKVKDNREKIKRDQIKGDIWPALCPLN